MKTRALIISATAGLACGLLIRFGISDAELFIPDAIRHHGPEVGRGASFPAGLAPAGNWESRISHYLETNPAASALTAAPAGSRALETDRLLDMLRQPVNTASILDGIAFLNGMDLADYADVMGSIFERWAKQCPDDALAAASELRHGEAKVALIWKVFQPMASEPDSMIKALAQPAGIFRSTACAAVVDTLAPDRLQDALTLSMRDRSPGSLPVMGTDSLQSLIVKRISQEDPEFPFKLASDTIDPEWRKVLLQMALVPLLHSDQPEYIRRLKAFAEDPRNAEALAEPVSNLLYFNAAEGIKLLSTLPEGNRRQVFQDFIGTSLAWFSDPRFRDFENRPGFELLRQDIIRREGADGFQAVLVDTALNHGAQGLGNAAKWLESRNDAAGLDDLTRRATQSEPFTTARWLATMGASPERDRAVAAFAEVHAATDPESAAVWAESISDPVRRDAVMKRVKHR